MPGLKVLTILETLPRLKVLAFGMRFGVEKLVANNRLDNHEWLFVVLHDVILDVEVDIRLLSYLT